MQPLLGGAGTRAGHDGAMLLVDTIRTWLHRRRRLRLEREAAELAELIRQAHCYARYSPFIASVLAYRRRKGFMTDRQRAALKRAVRMEWRISHGA